MKPTVPIYPLIPLADLRKLRQYYTVKQALGAAVHENFQKFYDCLKANNQSLYNPECTILKHDYPKLVQRAACAQACALVECLRAGDVAGVEHLVKAILGKVKCPVTAYGMVQGGFESVEAELEDVLELLLEDLHLCGLVVAHFGAGEICYSLPPSSEVPDAA